MRYSSYAPLLDNSPIASMTSSKTSSKCGTGLLHNLRGLIGKDEIDLVIPYVTCRIKSSYKIKYLSIFFFPVLSTNFSVSSLSWYQGYNDIINILLHKYYSTIYEYIHTYFSASELPVRERGASNDAIDNTTLHQCALNCHEWWMLIALQHYATVYSTTMNSVIKHHSRKNIYLHCFVVNKK